MVILVFLHFATTAHCNSNSEKLTHPNEYGSGVRYRNMLSKCGIVYVVC